jgi:hypothetical protein
MDYLDVLAMTQDRFNSNICGHDSLIAMECIRQLLDLIEERFHHRFAGQLIDHVYRSHQFGGCLTIGSLQDFAQKLELKIREFACVR